ncbi:MAG: hypothetical protein ACJ75J_14460 [Cytophagaceae bacterium]
MLFSVRVKGQQIIILNPDTSAIALAKNDSLRLYIEADKSQPYEYKLAGKVYILGGIGPGKFVESTQGRMKMMLQGNWSFFYPGRKIKEKETM